LIDLIWQPFVDALRLSIKKDEASSLAVQSHEEGSLECPHGSAAVHCWRVSTNSIPLRSARVRISPRRWIPKWIPKLDAGAALSYSIARRVNFRKAIRPHTDSMTAQEADGRRRHDEQRLRDLEAPEHEERDDEG